MNCKKVEAFFDWYICVEKVISRLFIVLFYILMSSILLCKSPEFIICADGGGLNILAMVQGILWVALLAT